MKLMSYYGIGKENVIEQLPEEWSAEAETKAPEQARRYQELQQKLVELNEKRNAAKEKLESHKKLKELLDPLGPEGEVQSNLVTKNGEVEQELEKMRRLMLRVERGLGTLGDANTSDAMNIDLEDGDTQKVMALFGRP